MGQVLVSGLYFSDVVDMLQRNGSNNGCTRSWSSFLYSGCFLEEIIGVGRLESESEGTVGLDNNVSRDRYAYLNV